MVLSIFDLRLASRGTSCSCISASWECNLCCSSLFPFSGWALGLHKIGECPKDVGASPIGWVWYVAVVGVGWEAYQVQALAIAGLSLGG